MCDAARNLAESLIDEVTERWGDAEGAALLPACGEQAAVERLDRLEHAVPSWKSFARAHPGLMLDHAERRLPEQPSGLLPAWWWRHAPGVAAAAPYAPARVVGLLERHRPPGPMRQALIQRVGLLLYAEPERMLALLLAPEHSRHLGGYNGPLWRRSVRDRLVRLGDDQLIAVARAVREDEAALSHERRGGSCRRRDRRSTARAVGGRADRVDASLGGPGRRSCAR